MLEHTLKRIVTQNGGFLCDTDIAELAELDRLRQVLVRCGCGRFVCAAQDVAHFIAILERDFKAQEAQATQQPAHAAFCYAESPIIAAVCKGADYVRDVSLLATDRAYTGHYGAVTPKPQPDPHAGNGTPRMGSPEWTADRNFREEDCGGAFDGFGVTSDADPGL